MIRTLRAAALLALAALSVHAMSGCAESSREQPTGKASIRSINAIADAPDVQFKIEERTLGTVAFGDASGLQRYDDLSYNFNFDVTVPGASSTRRLTSQFVDVAAERSYVFVLRGSIANPGLAMIDEELRQWAEGDTTFEMGFLNYSPSLGPVDIYFDAPGVAPVAGAAKASVDDGDRVAPVEFAQGQYVVTVTRAGDPADVLFVSATRTYNGATTDYIVLFDPDPSRTATVNVRHLTGAGGAQYLSDSRIPPTGRVRHAAIDIGPVDVAMDDDFANLLVSNQAFGETTADIDLNPGTTDFTWTDAGNQGAIILESEEPIASGFRTTLALVGPAADPDALNAISNRRPYSTSGRISFIHAAASRDAVDVYLLPAGESVDDNPPSSPNIAFKQTTGMVAIAPDTYEISVTPVGQKTLLAGPFVIDIALRDVAEVWLLDTVDPNVLDIDVTRF